MLKRIGLLSVVFFGFMAAPALAQQYPPDVNEVELSAMDGCPGDAATVTARTFAPGSAVQVTLLPAGTALGSATADGEGNVGLDATIPEDAAPGSYDVQVTGQGEDGDELVLSAAFEVQQCPAGETPPPDDSGVTAPGGDLPRTGSDSTMTLLKIGAALAALGGLLLALARRRQRNAALRTA